MRRTSVDEIKSSLENQGALRGLSEANRDANIRDQSRIRAETCLNGVATVLDLALLSTAIEGFPDVVHLSQGSPWSGNVVALRGRNGVWRLDGPFEALARFADAAPPRITVILSSLRAMGLPLSMEIRDDIARIASWPSDDSETRKTLLAITDAVPNHVLVASMGLGSALMRVLGRDEDYASVRDWVLAVSRHVGFSAQANGSELPIFEAIRRQDADCVLALMTHGGAKVTNRSREGLTPLLMALRHYDGQSLDVILNNAPDYLAVANDGSTALHCLAEATAAGRVPHALEAFKALVHKGCDDPMVEDKVGRTPLGILQEAIDGPIDESLSQMQLNGIRVATEYMELRRSKAFRP